MPGARLKKVVQDGDTVLVDKAKIPAKYIEVPSSVVEKALSKPREKKPLSEKQQANLQRLIEMNKKRREEKLAQMKVNVDDLGEIPEDKVVVKAVKTKVGRPRKNPPPKEEHEVVEHEVVELPASSSNRPPAKKPVLQREKKQVPRRPLSPPETEEEEEEEEEKAPVKKPRKKLVKAGKIVNKQRTVVRKPRYVSETSETEAADDEDSDSDYEEARVQKYVAKTKARMEALKQIESQLKPQSKYQGMSIF